MTARDDDTRAKRMRIFDALHAEGRMDALHAEALEIQALIDHGDALRAILRRDREPTE